MSSPDTPLFVKTRDWLLWLIQHTQRFPKNLRHSYTLKLETLALEFQEAILMANAVRGQQRSLPTPPRRLNQVTRQVRT
jgi:hypothetical protein